MNINTATAQTWVVIDKPHRPGRLHVEALRTQRNVGPRRAGASYRLPVGAEHELPRCQFCLAALVEATAR
jgi:hypothetical protein